MYVWRAYLPNGTGKHVAEQTCPSNKPQHHIINGFLPDTIKKINHDFLKYPFITIFIYINRFSILLWQKDSYRTMIEYLSASGGAPIR
jgi:hypothetical protein